MSKVRVQLVDKGSAIEAYGLKLSGSETQVVELTSYVKQLRMSGVVTYEELPEEAPTNEKKKQS